MWVANPLFRALAGVGLFVALITWQRIDAVNDYKNSLVDDFNIHRLETRETSDDLYDAIRQTGQCDLLERLLRRVHGGNQSHIRSALEGCGSETPAD